MDWHRFGGILIVLAFIVGSTGLYAGKIADNQTPLVSSDAPYMCEVVHFADSCAQLAHRDAVIATWTERGQIVAIGAAFVLAFGLAFYFAGAQR